MLIRHKYKWPNDGLIVSYITALLSIQLHKSSNHSAWSFYGMQICSLPIQRWRERRRTAWPCWMRSWAACLWMRATSLESGPKCLETPRRERAQRRADQRRKTPSFYHLSCWTRARIICGLPSQVRTFVLVRPRNEWTTEEFRFPPLGRTSLQAKTTQKHLNQPPFSWFN